MENFERDGSDFDSNHLTIWFVKELQELKAMGDSLKALWSFPQKEFESIEAQVRLFRCLFQACEIGAPQWWGRYEKSIGRSIELRALELRHYHSLPAFGADSHLQSLEVLWKATANGFCERVRGKQAFLLPTTKQVRWPILGPDVDDSLALIDWLQRNKEVSCFASVTCRADEEICRLQDPEVLLKLRPDLITKWANSFFMDEKEYSNMPFFVLDSLAKGSSLYTDAIIASVKARTEYRPTRRELERYTKDMKKLKLISYLGGNQITGSGEALFRAWKAAHHD